MAGLIERHADSLFALEAVIAATLLVYLGLGLTFVIDEWDFIRWAAMGSPNGLILPFNGHWTAMPSGLYRVLLEVVGLRTYVPYHFATVAAHIAYAAAVYLLVRRRVSGTMAVAIAPVALLLGVGYENLFWGFQVGYVGACAAGLWAIVLLEQPRVRDLHRAAACLLLVVAVASGSPGVMLLAGALVLAALRRDARSLIVLVVPALTYLIWFVATVQLRPGLPMPLADLLPLVPPFVLEGLARTVSGTLGLTHPSLAPFATAVLVGAAVAAAPRGWRPSPGVIGLLASASALFASVAVVRGGLGLGVVGSPRYLYAAVPVVLVLAAEVLPKVTRPEGASSRQRRWMAAAGVATLVVAVIGNGRLVLDGALHQRQSSAEARAVIEIATSGAGLSCNAEPVERVPEEVVIATMPGPLVLRELLARFGDPRDDVLAGAFVAHPTPRDLAMARALWCPQGTGGDRPEILARARIIGLAVLSSGS